MGIYDTQFGGAPLINTYQFNKGPGLPDISGFRGLLQSARIPSGAAAQSQRARDTEGDIKGLEGEVRTYRLAEAGLKAEKENTINQLMHSFENEHGGNWDDFWSANGEMLKQSSLKFQMLDAEMEGVKHSMAANRKLMDDLRGNKEMNHNVAIANTADGQFVFGERIDGTGAGWGRMNEIDRPMSTQETLSVIEKTAVAGQPLIFPGQYNKNKHTEEIAAHLDIARASTNRRLREGRELEVLGDVMSDEIQHRRLDVDNFAAIQSAIVNAHQALTPEGRTALFAEAVDQVATYRVNYANEELLATGVLDYEIHRGVDREGKPAMVVRPRRDTNGNLVVLDMNDPAQEQAALESIARKIAGDKAGARLEQTTEVKHDRILGARSREQQEQNEGKTGFNLMVTTDSVPTEPARRIKTVVTRGHNITGTLTDIAASLGGANTNLGRKYSNFVRGWREDNFAYANELNDSSLPAERRNEIMRKMLNDMRTKGDFSERDISAMLQSPMSAENTYHPNFIARTANRVLGVLNFTLDGSTAKIADNTIRPNEVYAMMHDGIEVKVYTDTQQGTQSFNNTSGYIHNSYIQMAGVHGVHTAHDVNPAGGVVFVAEKEAFTPKKWEGSNVGVNLDPNYGRSMSVYAGRVGFFVVPEKFLDNTDVEIIRNNEIELVRRNKIQELRRMDRISTIDLNSEQWVALFPNAEEARKAAAAFMRLHSPKNINPKVTIIRGSISINDPIKFDNQAGTDRSLDADNAAVDETLRYRQQKHAPGIMPMGQFEQPAGSAQQAPPRQQGAPPAAQERNFRLQ